MTNFQRIPTKTPLKQVALAGACRLADLAVIMLGLYATLCLVTA